MKVRRVAVSQFALAERVPIDIIRRQAAELGEAPVTSELLESVLNYLFILNPQGQIVFSSQNVGNWVPGKKPEDLLGLRFGEAIDCVHAKGDPAGCGAAPACSHCGALRAILSSVAGKPAAKTVRLVRFIGFHKEAVHFLAMSMRFVRNQQPFILLAVTDAANIKARQAMRRLFSQQLSGSKPPGNESKIRRSSSQNTRRGSHQ